MARALLLFKSCKLSENCRLLGSKLPNLCLEMYFVLFELLDVQI